MERTVIKTATKCWKLNREKPLFILLKI